VTDKDKHLLNATRLRMAAARAVRLGFYHEADQFLKRAERETRLAEGAKT
jgi:hypothetical protein